MTLKKYSIQNNATILEVLGQIEENKKGFVIIVNEKNVVKGTMTDGDVRRSILSGKRVTDTIDGLFSSNFTFVCEGESFEKVIEKFKSKKILFLPVLNKDRELINVLTKSQLHTVLLEGLDWNYHFDFTTIDNRENDHEIYNRPWGYYKTVFLSQSTRAKIIYVNPNEELSLQEHKKREEHWIIIKGEGEMTIGESVKPVFAGSYFFIPKGCKHRIVNVSEKNPLIISEVQLGNYFGEDDIIRYSDKYGRLNN
ncbi:cupin domain-containing protein [Bacillus sp. S/N-304-OC-R1]|uniref:cupin domain-containing protein n=1 Tax=Bacillus sp. S/N-304-OC-R1 TaxID=2758034 RepID=UPI001C8D8E4F|nr:cupin domain-containing protein [Bacillus sp. S/N-304-OC-R1]MBY0123458.1 cupin domain-containing protein [Bacillus sp. S/N-304-OC-R1]